MRRVGETRSKYFKKVEKSGGMLQDREEKERAEKMRGAKGTRQNDDKEPAGNKKVLMMDRT